MARLLLGVSGGIAAYKAIELARLAIKAGHASASSRPRRRPASSARRRFAGITGAPVLVSEFEPDPLRGAFPGDPAPEHAPIGHLELVERADAFLIAPASANTIAKLAAGQADNLLTAAALACRRPLIVAPAMNGAMYEHPATQENLARLRARGAPCSSRAPARSPRSASTAPAACPSRPSCWRPSRPRSSPAASSTG